MKTETFRVIAKMVQADPLTDGQVRELTGADKDEIVDGETAARMLGVEVRQLSRFRGLKRVRCNTRYLRYRLVDVRRYRDEHTW